jgi:hypothetical protein
MKHLQWALALAVGLAVSLISWEASAYTWMIARGYTNCAQCHTDPSGGGNLTRYGRALGSVALSTHWGEREPDPSRGMFLWGTADLPKSLELGGDVRVLRMIRKIEGRKSSAETVFMQADLEAALSVGRFVAAGSVGYAHEGALGAAITRDTRPNLVSRQHWVGYGLDDDRRWLLRAGRMNLPFGLRVTEHTYWVRNLSRTDINDDQQHGVSLAYSGERTRGELMTILGNYQLRPDELRERGYSGFLEWMATRRLGLGVSSLATHRAVDARTQEPAWRHAHGAFGRWHVAKRPGLVLMSEWNYLIESARNSPRTEGVTGLTVLDLEAVQGLHLSTSQEFTTVGFGSKRLSHSQWLSAVWFFLPQLDTRLDLVRQSIAVPGGGEWAQAYAALLQLHVAL